MNRAVWPCFAETNVPSLRDAKRIGWWCEIRQGRVGPAVLPLAWLGDVQTSIQNALWDVGAVGRPARCLDVMKTMIDMVAFHPTRLYRCGFGVLEPLFSAELPSEAVGTERSALCWITEKSKVQGQGESNHPATHQPYIVGVRRRSPVLGLSLQVPFPLFPPG
jgi:hypothetical protein